jgi:hypothetical protein
MLRTVAGSAVLDFLVRISVSGATHELDFLEFDGPPPQRRPPCANVILLINHDFN